PAPNSGVLDLAMTTAPFRSSRSTRMSECSETCSAKMGEPRVVRTPLTSTRSLIAIGSPARRLFSGSARAAFLARSAQSVGKALTSGSTAAMRASEASMSSRGEISRRSKRATAWRAVSLVSSSAMALRVEQSRAVAVNRMSSALVKRGGKGLECGAPRRGTGMRQQAKEGAHTLKGNALLDGLPQNARERYEHSCLWRRYKPDEQIIDKMSDSRDVFFVVEGSVRIVNFSLS